MIVVAIIGILASIALPAYQTYTKKAKYTEVISNTFAMKAAVEICAQDQAATTPCNPGILGVPANVTVPVGYLQSLTVSAGVITATAISSSGLAGETFILTPTLSGAKVTWGKSGTCLAAQIC